ncbi:hypothetical protein [Mesorhizobium sp. WSM2240]
MQIEEGLVWLPQCAHADVQMVTAPLDHGASGPPATRHDDGESADGGAGCDRDVLKTLYGKALRVGNGCNQFAGTIDAAAAVPGSVA